MKASTMRIARARSIFSTIIDYSFAAYYNGIIFSPMVSRLNIREVRRGEVPGH